MELKFVFKDKGYFVSIEDSEVYKIDDIQFIGSIAYQVESFHIKILGISKKDNLKFGGTIEVTKYEYTKKDFILNDFINEKFNKETSKLFDR